MKDYDFSFMDQNIKYDFCISFHYDKKNGNLLYRFINNIKEDYDFSSMWILKLLTNNQQNVRWKPILPYEILPSEKAMNYADKIIKKYYFNKIFW